MVTREEFRKILTEEIWALWHKYEPPNGWSKPAGANRCEQVFEIYGIRFFWYATWEGASWVFSLRCTGNDMDNQWVSLKVSLARMIRDVDEMLLPDVEEPKDAIPTPRAASRPIPEHYGTW